MGRKPKDGKVKSGSELENDYIAKVEHCVERLTMWGTKLSKLARSKKGYLTEAERRTIASTVGSLADNIGEALTNPSVGSANIGFKLR